MARLRCVACLGEYDDVLPDGTLYFHTCPELRDDDVIAALGLPLDPVLWTPAQRRQFERADRRRANHRDENVDPSKAAAVEHDPARRPGRTPDPALMKAQGAGVTRL